MKKTAITTLFVDVGGVMLSNGWDHQSRELAAKTFKLDFSEMEARHRLTFDTYEVGKLSLEEYLNRVVFYEKRSFNHRQFQDFMFDQTKPFTDMIELLSGLKKQYGLKIIVVSNEGRELTEHRVSKFKLDSFVDSFISSCFVHLRKPDKDIYRLALDIAQAPLSQILYIEDRDMFVQVAESLQIPSLHHIDYQSTRAKLAAMGLEEGQHR